MSVLMRERLQHVPGITVTHIGLVDSVGGGKQITFSLIGADTQTLERLAQLAMPRLRAIPGLVDLDSSMKPNKPTLELRVKREGASDLGLSLSQIGSSLRTLVAGQTVGNWRAQDDQTYDVNVRLQPQARDNPADLERMPLAMGSNPDGSNRTVRLNQVADLVESTGSNQINRRDMQREVSINANVSGRSAGEVSKDIQAVMDSIAMPPGYSMQFSGSTKDMGDSFGYAVSALALGIVFIYMILASQFKSFLQPLALMTALPLTWAKSSESWPVRRCDKSTRIAETSLLVWPSATPLMLSAPFSLAAIRLASSLLPLVVVPVSYCYLDDLGQWVRRILGLPSPEATSPAPLDR